MVEEAKNSSKITIKGKDLSKKTVEILMGEKGAEELKEEWLPVAQAVERPDELPFLVSEILELEKTKELRKALLRVQINAQLKRDQDLNFYKKQLFAATTIEILLYKRLRLKSRAKRKKKTEEKEESGKTPEEKEMGDDRDQSS